MNQQIPKIATPSSAGSVPDSETVQIRLSLEGDLEAFSDLVRPYRPMFYKKALSIVRNEADAEDVTQTALLKAFTRLSQFRLDSQFRTGDLYFLCSVVHDWDDERAVTILRNCREAMSTTGRLLLLETVVLENDSKHFGKILDLNMMAVSSGRERTRAEFCTLLTASGFRMSRNIPTMAPQNLIEAVPQ
jgi:O-methyltransferase domain/Sigma-70 region 2